MSYSSTEFSARVFNERVSSEHQQLGLDPDLGIRALDLKCDADISDPDYIDYLAAGYLVLPKSEDERQRYIGVLLPGARTALPEVSELVVRVATRSSEGVLSFDQASVRNVIDGALNEVGSVRTRQMPKLAYLGCLGLDLTDRVGIVEPAGQELPSAQMLHTGLYYASFGEQIPGLHPTA